MSAITIIFWLSVAIIFYSYLGYGILLYLIILLKRTFIRKEIEGSDGIEPEITVLIAAYNELFYLQRKVDNTLALDYPMDKLKVLFVTDGSDDGSYEFLSDIQEVDVLHDNERKGEI